jgi:hypothetical protein
MKITAHVKCMPWWIGIMIYLILKMFFPLAHLGAYFLPWGLFCVIFNNAKIVEQGWLFSGYFVAHYCILFLQVIHVIIDVFCIQHLYLSCGVGFCIISTLLDPVNTLGSSFDCDILMVAFSLSTFNFPRFTTTMKNTSFDPPPTSL